MSAAGPAVPSSSSSSTAAAASAPALSATTNEIKDTAPNTVAEKKKGKDDTSSAAPAPAAIIIDNGTWMTKLGFGGDNEPCVRVPTVISAPFRGVMVGMGQKAQYAGDEAIAKRGILRLRYPVRRGLIQGDGLTTTETNWPLMEAYWRHCINQELRIPADRALDQPCLVLESPGNPAVTRETTTQVMMESIGVSQFYLANSSVMALYGQGRSTGLVMDSGDGITTVCPVYEGHALPHAIIRSQLAGRDITGYLRDLINGDAHTFTSPREEEIVRDIKHRHGYVSIDAESEMKHYRSLYSDEKKRTGATITQPSDVAAAAALGAPPSDGKQYELPDGTIMNLSWEVMQCTEPLWTPSMMTQTEYNYTTTAMESTICNQPSVPSMICDSLSLCDHDFISELRSRILLIGGNTSFNGFATRLRSELQRRAPFDKLSYGSEWNIIEPTQPSTANRSCISWYGASVWSSVMAAANPSIWITKAEYDETGPSIVHRKCF